MNGPAIGAESTTRWIVGGVAVVLLAVGAGYVFLGAPIGPHDGYKDGQAVTPPVSEIPEGGAGRNFELVAHQPLHDDHQYVDETLGIPRGSNGDVTVAGDCVYVGSLVGVQPPVIVDVADPEDPEVVGPVPDAVPGVGNGIEGIAASGDALVVDHRQPLGGLSLDVPEGTPARGVSVWDVSEDCREPELVARYDYGDREVHALSLWRDPADPDRLLGVQTFTDGTDVAVLDLTGCPDPDACDPEIAAEWDLRTQTGGGNPAHEAVTSTDGTRIYVAQLGTGVVVLDSSNLLAALRGGEACEAAPPRDLPGEDHCLTAADPDLEGSLAAQPDLDREAQHTALKVPDRPYLLASTESAGPQWDEDTGEVRLGDCPGAVVRFFGIDGEDGTDGDGDADGNARAGTVDPEVRGLYSLPEQRADNCDRDGGWDPDAVAPPAWLSPHFSTVFPDVAFVTYYSAGIRAVDISDPTDPVEAGHFFNEPVEEVRWESYGMQGERQWADDEPLRQTVADTTHMFAFSYPVVHDGYVVYADVHSGLYVLEYDGPHADQLPDDGTCLSGNPGAVEPGFEPCPPYGETDWEDA